MIRQAINPDGLFDSTQYGFSQVIIAQPGNPVFISGQVAWDENLNIVGKNDLKTQTQKAIDNLNIAINSVGGTLDNIMMLRIYKVNYVQEDGPVINTILKENFGTKNPPASTWVSVDGLANEGFLIEIEAQAIV